LSEYLIRKLGGAIPLTAEDEETLARLGRLKVRNFSPRSNIVAEGDEAKAFYLIQQGWAYAYNSLEDGRRPITAFYLPGDICHVSGPALGRMDHSIGTITATAVSELSQRAYEELVASNRTIANVIWREFLVGFSVQREWTVNIAQRSALARVAHLICELYLRLGNVGLTDGDSCEFPLTQTDLADALGLTAIHVNRMLQQLRSLDLVVFKERQLTVRDIAALQRIATFSPSYLHL
jgi:CRP-like cAMP-binding protein